MRLLALARAAIASTRAPPRPNRANSILAASRMRFCVASALRGRCFGFFMTAPVEARSLLYKINVEITNWLVIRRRSGAEAGAGTLPMYDYVIAGGGTAGCVLAARLSELPDAKVLLIEAGPRDHNPYIHMPVGFFKMTSGPLVWGF